MIAIGNILMEFSPFLAQTANALELRRLPVDGPTESFDGEGTFAELCAAGDLPPDAGFLALIGGRSEPVDWLSIGLTESLAFLIWRI
jgi:hypothetical protein